MLYININHEWHDLIMYLIELTDNISHKNKIGFTAYDYYKKYHSKNNILSEKEVLLLKG